MKVDRTLIEFLVDFEKFESETIDTILSTLQMNKDSEFKLYQAFYDSAMFPPVNISIITSNKFNLAFLTTYDVKADKSYILEAMRRLSHYYPEIVDKVYKNEDVSTELWFAYTFFDDNKLNEFIQKVSSLNITSLSTTDKVSGSDDLYLYQFGRYFEYPDIRHTFAFNRRDFSTTEEQTASYFAYFMYLLQFLKSLLNDKVAIGVINIILKHYF
jgi:hypothetical protein